MSAFDNATRFFHACEGLEGWNGCKQYVAPGAGFVVQSDALTDIDTVQGYSEWMAGLGTNLMPGCGYELHASAYDEATRTALFFATFKGTHTGAGGPVPPTHKHTNSHYVYALTMDDNDLVSGMVKIWNSAWALAELGWA